jgi:hypothetical protein
MKDNPIPEFNIISEKENKKWDSFKEQEAHCSLTLTER